MRVTMRDVAGRAGVSVKTVSRVVNGEPHIRPETRELVHAAITELEWVPNAAARTLRTGRTGVVAIAVAELRRPSLARITEALVSEVDRHGLHAAVEPTHDDPVRSQDVLSRIGRTFDGVLMVRPTVPLPPARPGRPVVVVDGVPDEDPAAHEQVSPGVDQVRPDLEEIVSLTARHLAVMGRTAPVLLGHPPAVAWTLRDRLAAGGLRVVGEVVPVVATSARRDGFEAAQRITREHPDADALVCVSDEAALGALAGLADAGVSVPDQVAVIGCGNLEDGQFSTPSLTTVDLDPDRIARVSVDLMVERLAGEAARPPVTTPVALVRRESTLGRGGR